MLALWGDTGIAQAAATPLDTWKIWATNVTGAPIDSGHFLTEEDPDATGEGSEGVSLAPGLEKLAQQHRRLALADRRINLRRVVTGRRGEEPHAGSTAPPLGSAAP